MLVAQALVEGATTVTHDPQLERYDVFARFLKPRVTSVERPIYHQPRPGPPKTPLPQGPVIANVTPGV